jgi:hypothetical protein
MKIYLMTNLTIFIDIIIIDTFLCIVSQTQDPLTSYYARIVFFFGRKE